MSDYTQVLSQLASIKEYIINIGENQQNLLDFVEATELNISDFIEVSQGGSNKKAPLSLLLSLIETQNVKSKPFVLVPTTDNQTIFNVPNSPNNIDLRKGRVIQIEDYDNETNDFNYNPNTGVLVCSRGVNASKGERLFGRAYGNDFSTVQYIKATSEGQTEFFFSGAPESIEVSVGRVMLNENYTEDDEVIIRDYSRTNYSTNNKINTTKGVALDAIIKIRKF